MSTLKHPAGRQSQTVYRRRRLLVGLTLVAIVVAIVLIVVKPGSSNADQKPPAATAAATATSTPASTPAPKTTAPAGTTPKAGAPCTAATVRVEAVTDATHYAPGQQPKLSLRVTNTGPVACTLNAGTSKQVFTISSGSDVYWKSTDCQVNAGDAVVTLKPGKPISSATPIAWERVRSSPDTCDASTRPAAPAGGASYNLSVTIGGIASAAPKQFILD